MSIAMRVAGKTGVIGIVVGSFGCAACFPAAASVGAAIGLGFLGQWDGLLASVLIPIFALVALSASVAGGYSHRDLRRAAMGSVGPILVLIGAFGLTGLFGMTHGFLPVAVARGTFYVGVITMLIVAVWNLVRPARQWCRTGDDRISTR